MCSDFNATRTLLEIPDGLSFPAFFVMAKMEVICYMTRSWLFCWIQIEMDLIEIFCRVGEVWREVEKLLFEMLNQAHVSV